MTYTLNETGGVIRDVDNTFVPEDDFNTDWQEYQRWLADGNTPTPASVVPKDPISCYLWQLEAVCNDPPADLGFTPPTWSQVEALVRLQGNAALTAFFNVGTNLIPSISPTLIGLAAMAPNPLSVEQVKALITAGSEIIIH